TQFRGQGGEGPFERRKAEIRLRDVVVIRVDDQLGALAHRREIAEHLAAVVIERHVPREPGGECLLLLERQEARVVAAPRARRLAVADDDQLMLAQGGKAPYRL